jgi:hypothetical protein
MEAWLAARRHEVLPVPYFHLVFTLPHELNALLAATPKPLYENLFSAVSATLAGFAASPRHLGGVPAFSLVLHTWKQADWQPLKQRLHTHDWVVYAKQPLGGPEAVLESHGRYTHRVAISNERILGIDGNDVLLRVRADPTSGKKRTLRVPGTEFIDRFLQHVLPVGFKRISHYGLLSPTRKREALAAARAALNVPPHAPAVVESVAEFMQRVTCIEQARCPHCGIGQFRVVATLLPQRDPPKLRGPP